MIKLVFSQARAHTFEVRYVLRYFFYCLYLFCQVVTLEEVTELREKARVNIIISILS